MGFCQWAEMGPKVGQKWVFGCESGFKTCQNPPFHPLKTHFGISTKTHFLPSLRGVEIFSKKAPEAVPTQHNPLRENLPNFPLEGKFFRSHPGKPNQRKASSWTFPGGIPEQKFNVNRACFPKENHQNSQKWAKFMNFSFWPCLWFGLPGRLLNFVSRKMFRVSFSCLPCIRGPRGSAAPDAGMLDRDRRKRSRSLLHYLGTG